MDETVRDKLERLITFHEGVRQLAYKDSLGLLTIGVGHLLNVVKDATLPAALRVAVASRRLTLEQVRELFLYDLADHMETLVRYFPWTEKLDDVRRAVVIDMAFNMGPMFLSGWPVFVKQLRSADWTGAARNMRGSLWAKQVKTRAERLARMMETGTWPDDVA